VGLRDGRRLTRRVDHARGTQQNPLTPADIHAKYLKLSTTVVTPAHAERIAATVARIHRLRDVGELARLVRTLPAPRAATSRRS
jgi:2-methylcitrate dehydratase PrpD